MKQKKLSHEKAKDWREKRTNWHDVDQVPSWGSSQSKLLGSLVDELNEGIVVLLDLIPMGDG